MACLIYNGTGVNRVHLNSYDVQWAKIWLEKRKSPSFFIWQRLKGYRCECEKPLVTGIYFYRLFKRCKHCVNIEWRKSFCFLVARYKYEHLITDITNRDVSVQEDISHHKIKQIYLHKFCVSFKAMCENLSSPVVLSSYNIFRKWNTLDFISENYLWITKLNSCKKSCIAPVFLENPVNHKMRYPE